MQRSFDRVCQSFIWFSSLLSSIPAHEFVWQSRPFATFALSNISTHWQLAKNRANRESSSVCTSNFVAWKSRSTNLYWYYLTISPRILEVNQANKNSFQIDHISYINFFSNSLILEGPSFCSYVFPNKTPKGEHIENKHAEHRVMSMGFISFITSMHVGRLPPKHPTSRQLLYQLETKALYLPLALQERNIHLSGYGGGDKPQTEVKQHVINIHAGSPFTIAFALKKPNLPLIWGFCSSSKVV